MAPAGPGATELARSGQSAIPPHFHANPSRLTVPGNQLKNRGDRCGNRLGSARRGINKDPFSFAGGDDRLSRRPHKLVFSERPDPAKLGYPSECRQQLTEKRGAQVFNPVRPRHPRRAHGACCARTTDRIRMPHRDVLHPLHIGHVIDMAIRIDDSGWNGEFVAVDCDQAQGFFFGPLNAALN